MNVSTTIGLIWQLAAREAAAAEFAEIQPEHFVHALLKLAEFSPEEVERMAEATGGGRQLGEEVAVIHAAWEERQVDTTAARRALRGQLGRGGHPPQGGQPHRSPAAREAFDRAATAAAEAGSATLMALHLLRALCAAPTPALQQVLGAALEPLAPSPEVPPLLAEYGRDLTDEEYLVTEAKQVFTECQALVEVLARPDRRSVLLVGEGDGLDYFRHVAHAVGRPGQTPISAAERLSDKRLVTTLWLSKTPAPGEAANLQEMLLTEAAGKPIILHVPPLSDANEALPAEKWAAVLKRRVGQTQCVCQVSPDTYARLVAPDPEWSKRAHVMWLQARSVDAIPHEL